jgi:uncharacterized protein YjbI with pentapeptide repeats
LSYADLSATNSVSANLSNANLSDAVLLGANLSYANLSNANLSTTNLLGADLSYANLSNANLSQAGLIGVNLSGTNLHGADLTDSIIINNNFSENTKVEETTVKHAIIDNHNFLEYLRQNGSLDIPKEIQNKQELISKLDSLNLPTLRKHFMYKMLLDRSKLTFPK